jgi:hypothetical protein
VRKVITTSAWSPEVLNDIAADVVTVGGYPSGKVLAQISMKKADLPAVRLGRGQP